MTWLCPVAVSTPAPQWNAEGVSQCVSVVGMAAGNIQVDTQMVLRDLRGTVAAALGLLGIQLVRWCAMTGIAVTDAQAVSVLPRLRVATVAMPSQLDT